MNKITISVICGLIVLGVVFALVSQKSKNPTPSIKDMTKTAPTTAEVQTKTYTNESGFSFKYQKSLVLTEKEIIDESTYASVELKNPKNKAVISINLVDSNIAEIDDWFTPTIKENIKGEIKEIKLDDIDARQFTGKEDVLTTIALDKGGVLITIFGNPAKAHQQIVSSFVFNRETETNVDTSSDAGGDGGGIIFEGEEVIE